MTGLRSAGRTEPRVFAWITGELTNVGDSLLRRPYLDALRQIGQIDIWTRRSTPDFLSGLGVQPTDILTPRFAVWYIRVLMSALRGRTVLVLNAGESRVEPTRAVLLSMLLLASMLVRIRGGCSLWVGVSIPMSSKRLLALPYRLAGRYIDAIQWRENGSSATAFPRAVGPDWAFLEGSPTNSWSQNGREHLGLVLRGDREVPSPEWFTWLRSFCVDHDLRPIVLVQVRQDAQRARQIASELGASVIEWSPEATHADQEMLLRDAYRGCRVVIGDRLHGLVMGATEGALPLGWVESSTGKIRAHFDVIGLEVAGVHEGDGPGQLPKLSAATVSTAIDALAAAIDHSRAELRALQDAIAQLAVQKRPDALARLRRPTS